ncbi:MAG: hypothetical protein GDA41_10520 [Rhodospirillales bacterium]|nr:hypothetical protein [Rhodospirillales bacterium]
MIRDLAEVAHLGRALGAKPETLMGLAGLGDLILTGPREFAELRLRLGARARRKAGRRFGGGLRSLLRW